MDGGLPEGATSSLSALSTGELNQSTKGTDRHIPVRVRNERSYMLYLGLIFSSSFGSMMHLGQIKAVGVAAEKQPVVLSTSNLRPRSALPCHRAPL